MSLWNHIKSRLLGYNICQFPVNKTNKIVGWSHGYENLVMDWKETNFTYELWDGLADEMAKYVNSIRLFAYISEDQFYVDNSYCPFPRVNGKYDLRKLDKQYVKEVKKRFKSFHKRKITTIVCLLSSIKGWRFKYCPFNGDNNINGTCTSYRYFLSDDKTKRMTKRYFKKFARKFDNKYMIYELGNEFNPSVFGREALFKWNKEMIKYLKSLGVPAKRIAVEPFDSRYMYDILNMKVWMFYHGLNSLETRKWWRTSEERRELYKAGKMCGSGDGGDEFRKARGLVEKDGKFIRASSKQMFQMMKYDQQFGEPYNNGIEFMSASAFCFGWQDCYWANLKDAIRIGTKGLTKDECQQLGVEYNWNRAPELKRIYLGYKIGNE